MSNKQKLKTLRKIFRESCLKRDKNKCVFCSEKNELDVHHITDRNEIPNGGYTIWNGITLCKKHHWDCEQYHISNGKYVEPQYHPDILYQMINSSKEKAIEESEKL